MQCVTQLTTRVNSIYAAILLQDKVARSYCRITSPFNTKRKKKSMCNCLRCRRKRGKGKKRRKTRERKGRNAFLVSAVPPSHPRFPSTQTNVCEGKHFPATCCLIRWKMLLLATPAVLRVTPTPSTKKKGVLLSATCCHHL